MCKEKEKREMAALLAVLQGMAAVAQGKPDVALQG